jgi:uncharacterized Zn-finger protein
MTKVEIFYIENKLLKNVFILDKLDYNNLSKLVFGLELSEVQFLKELSKSGLDMYVTPNYNSNDSDIEGFNYELNVTSPNGNITSFKFQTNDFDEEEVNALNEIPEIAEINTFDEDFKKLMSSIYISEGDWLVLLRYLTRVYKFKFDFIYFILTENEEVS